MNNKMVRIWKNVTWFLIRRVCVRVKKLMKNIKDLLEQPHCELKFVPQTSNTEA